MDRVLRFDGPAARGLWIAADAAISIKPALRGLHLCHHGSPVISSGGICRHESHSFMEPMKGSREISLQNAALQSVS